MSSHDVSRRLKEEMREKRISTTDLAAELDISTSRMSQIRHGAPMSQPQLTAICDFLDLSPTWLLYGKGDRHLSDFDENDS